MEDPNKLGDQFKWFLGWDTPPDNCRYVQLEARAERQGCVLASSL